MFFFLILKLHSFHWIFQQGLRIYFNKWILGKKKQLIVTHNSIVLTQMNRGLWKLKKKETLCVQHRFTLSSILHDEAAADFHIWPSDPRWETGFIVPICCCTQCVCVVIWFCTELCRIFVTYRWIIIYSLLGSQGSVCFTTERCAWCFQRENNFFNKIVEMSRFLENKST